MPGIPDSYCRRGMNLKNMYDLIIIGGGINGCGIARDAALRGLKTLLVEKNDFAAGTSGANSQMIHGGARYLLSDLHTTQTSCLDSGYIQRIASHLVFRIPFIFPVFCEAGDSLFAKKLELELLETFFKAYDRYVPFKNGKPHTRLSKEEALQIEPGLNKNVIGAVTFDEWGLDSTRLTFLNALSAAEQGAEIKNHTEVLEILKEENQVKGVKLRNTFTGAISEARAKIVLNAAGPWASKIAKMAGVELRLRPAKGIHLSFDRQFVNSAILAKAMDGRSIFLMPHRNETILGTTDDDYFGDPDHLEILPDEIEYLLEGIEKVFPAIRQARITRAWAGIRPTLYERNKYEDDLTREHEVFDHEVRDGVKGFFSIAGGKLASFRLMSEETTNQICKKLGNTSACRTHQLPLPGSEQTVNVQELAQKFNVPLYAVRSLAWRHGSRVKEILELMASNIDHKNIICDCEPVLDAEIRYVIRNQWARTLDDVKRRTRFSLGPCEGGRCLMMGAQILGQELGLSPREVFSHAGDFLQLKWQGRKMLLHNFQLQQEELNQATYLNVACLDQNAS